jgi:hypothetical protein
MDDAPAAAPGAQQTSGPDDLMPQHLPLMPDAASPPDASDASSTPNSAAAAAEPTADVVVGRPAEGGGESGIDDEEEFVVGQVLKKRRGQGGRDEYLVRWMGYGSEDDTWEPTGHLSNAAAKLEDFHRRTGARLPADVVNEGSVGGEVPEQLLARFAKWDGSGVSVRTQKKYAGWVRRIIERGHGVEVGLTAGTRLRDLNIRAEPACKLSAASAGEANAAVQKWLAFLCAVGGSEPDVAPKIPVEPAAREGRVGDGEATWDPKSNLEGSQQLAEIEEAARPLAEPAPPPPPAAPPPPTELPVGQARLRAGDTVRVQFAAAHEGVYEGVVQRSEGDGTQVRWPLRSPSGVHAAWSYGCGWR